MNPPDLFFVLHVLEILWRSKDAIHIIESIFVRDLYMQELQLEILVASASDEFLDGPVECIFAADRGMRVPLQRGLVHTHQYASRTILPFCH